MKKLNIFYSIVLLILFTTFFFKVIPVSVPGGIYWSSGLYELSVGNPGFLYYSLFFTTLFLTKPMMEIK